MIEIGKSNRLVVIETAANGVYLTPGEHPQLFLPLDRGARQLETGEEVDVFIYTNADGEPVATFAMPLAELGQVAWLEVLEVNNLGAFADWGLPKDLFIPYAEQQHTLRQGQHVLVKVYLDNQGRLAGSTRLDSMIKDDATGLEPGQQVSLIIADRTELGFKAIINHRCWGLLYGNELFRTLRKGVATQGYVKLVRPDGKVDLTLDKPGFTRGRVEGVGEQIIRQLELNDGSLPLTDKSPPQTIYAAFGVSKKVFKQALGALYKQRRIVIEADGIRLV